MSESIMRSGRISVHIPNRVGRAMAELQVQRNTELLVSCTFGEAPCITTGKLVDVMPYASITLRGETIPFISDSRAIVKIKNKNTGFIYYESGIAPGFYKNKSPISGEDLYNLREKVFGSGVALGLSDETAFNSRSVMESLFRLLRGSRLLR
jgi:hypothetical protein